ncbi:hypothetical protein XENOCAPTIV_002802 [Xenoophorus captivus]|uniref:Battenin n=1 Tax=Xenoophorus captivus TaxID=1517983 RepID=A0ABV0QPK1_9TELE
MSSKVWYGLLLHWDWSTLLSTSSTKAWYQTLYQIGVLVSRSSLYCIKFKRVWIFSLLQVVNAVFLLFAVRFQFLPSAWIVLVIILYEGLLGGAAYVNTFYFISKEVTSPVCQLVSYLRVRKIEDETESMDIFTVLNLFLP